MDKVGVQSVVIASNYEDVLRLLNGSTLKIGCTSGAVILRSWLYISLIMTLAIAIAPSDKVGNSL